MMRYSFPSALLRALFVIFFIIAVNEAHVSLTFPPARQPALDFLDSGRTPVSDDDTFYHSGYII